MTSSPPTSDEKQIRDLVARWMAATKTGDLDTVLGLMSDDVKFLVAGHAPFGKQEFAAAMRPAAPGTAAPRIDGHSEILELEIDGNIAWIVTRLTVDVAAPDGPTTRRQGHTLTVLRKRAGRWQLARDANLLAPVKL